MGKARGVNKATLNYWVDVVIAIAFVLSGLSGVVFLLPVGLTGATGVLGLAYLVWDKIHIWSSLAMMVGVGAHLLLHAKWIASMTKRVCGIAERQQRVAARSPVQANQAAASKADAGANVGRRRLLVGGGLTLGVGVLTAACGGVAWAAAKLFELDAGEGEAAVSTGVASPDPTPASAEVAEADAFGDEVSGGRRRGRSQREAPRSDESDHDLGGEGGEGDQPEAETLVPDSTPTPDATVAPTSAPTVAPTPAVTEESARMCVSCPRNLVNDPYPGRCRLYVDENQNGICDLSEPTPCG